MLYIVSLFLVNIYFFGYEAFQYESQVSEILDSELLGEGLIPTLQHAHDKLLVENPLTVPYKATTYGQVFDWNGFIVNIVWHLYPSLLYLQFFFVIVFFFKSFLMLILLGTFLSIV